MTFRRALVAITECYGVSFSLKIRNLFLYCYVFGQCQVTNRLLIAISIFNRFIHMKTVILA